MPFAIAYMSWETKRTTIKHDSYDLCPIPWRVGSVRCNTTADHNHSPSIGPWVFGPYTPTPVGEIAPKGMDAELIYDPTRIIQASQLTYFKCFKDGVQMRLMVRFMDGTPEPLIINLSME